MNCWRFIDVQLQINTTVNAIQPMLISQLPEPFLRLDYDDPELMNYGVNHEVACVTQYSPIVTQESVIQKPYRQQHKVVEETQWIWHNVNSPKPEKQGMCLKRRFIPMMN
jgi:hypothetical protein